MQIERILYIHNNALDFNFANMVQVVNVCQSLDHVGYKVTLCLPNIKESLKRQRLKYLYTTFSPKFDVIWYNNSKVVRGLGLLGLPQFILLNNIKKNDLIFTRDPSIVRRLHRVTTPILYEAHNYLFDQRGGKYDNSYLKVMLKVFLNKNNHIITISDALKEYLILNGFLSSRILVEHDCHNGLSWDLNCVSNELVEKIRELKSEYEYFVVYTGSLSCDRGLEILKDLIVKKNSCFFFIAGGSQKDIDYWTNVIGESANYVIYKRLNVDEVKFIQSQSDILLGIWSSKIKTMNYCSPLKIFEYLSTGKPIILPLFPTFLEVVDESTVFYFEKENAISLIDNFEKAVAKIDNFDLIKKNMLELSEYYTWNNRAHRIKNFIDSL